jgi:propionate catabolism operon transcriptional regulator
MAHHGTIFLDEIGEMSSALQSKLLRVIQEKQVLRVGGTKLIPVDARIIVATNQNLWELVQNNSFRKDLYYRLNVLELEIPPLCARKDDIIMLFLEFLKALSPAAWSVISHISGELEKYLCEYSWPGNVRELENFAHTLVASFRPGDPPLQLIMLTADSLKRKQLRFKPLGSNGGANQTLEAPNRQFTDSPSETAAADYGFIKAKTNSASFTDIKSLTDKKIEETMAACNGNIPQAAFLLGIHRTTLWRKMRKKQLHEAH